MHWKAFSTGDQLVVTDGRIVSNSTIEYIVPPEIVCLGIIGRSMFYGLSDNKLAYISIDWQKPQFTFSLVKTRLPLDTMEEIALPLLKTPFYKRYIYPVDQSFSVVFCAVNRKTLSIVILDTECPTMKVLNFILQNHYELISVEDNGNNGYMILLANGNNISFWNSETKVLVDLKCFPRAIIPISDTRTLVLLDQLIFKNSNDTDDLFVYELDVETIIPMNKKGLITILNKDGSMYSFQL